jgi:prepilin peptidase CpaA
MTKNQIIFSVLVLFTLVAAYRDLRTGHIPNRLVLLGVIAGVAVQVLAQVISRPAPNAAWTASLLRFGMAVVVGPLACGAVPYFLFRVGAMGGGDVKLLAAVGVGSGPFLGLRVEFLAFVLAAVFALSQMAYRGQLLRLLASSAWTLINPLLPRTRRRPVPPELLTPLPLGPAVSAATLFCLVGECLHGWT